MSCEVCSSVRPFQQSAGSPIAWVAVYFLIIRGDEPAALLGVGLVCRGMLTGTALQGGATMWPTGSGSGLRLAVLGGRDFKRFDWVRPRLPRPRSPIGR